MGDRIQKSLSVSAHADRKFLKRIIFYMQKTKNFKNYNFPKEILKATIFRFIVPVALGFTNISWLDHFSFFAIFSHFKPLECVIMNLIFSVQNVHQTKCHTSTILNNFRRKMTFWSKNNSKFLIKWST